MIPQKGPDGLRRYGPAAWSPGGQPFIALDRLGWAVSAKETICPRCRAERRKT
jgi:hypothetical protein